MQLTLHTTRRTHHGVSDLVVDCEAGPAKTRRARSRLCWNAGSMVLPLYGMQDHEYNTTGHTLHPGIAEWISTPVQRRLSSCKLCHPKSSCYLHCHVFNNDNPTFVRKRPHKTELGEIEPTFHPLAWSVAPVAQLITS